MDDPIKEKLREAVRLIEAALGERPSKTRTVGASGHPERFADAGPKTLAENILALRGSGFFAEPRTEKETFEKVLETYYCERKRVGVELIRLYRRRELRRASKVVEGKKLIAYVR